MYKKIGNNPVTILKTRNYETIKKQILMDKLVKSIRIHKGVNINNPLLKKYDAACAESTLMQLDCDMVVSNVKYLGGIKHLVIEGENVKANYKNNLGDERI